MPKNNITIEEIIDTLKEFKVNYEEEKKRRETTEKERDNYKNELDNTKEELEEVEEKLKNIKHEFKFEVVEKVCACGGRNLEGLKVCGDCYRPRPEERGFFFNNTEVGMEKGTNTSEEKIK